MDHKPDIAAEGSNGLAVLFGHGDGTFQPASFPFTSSIFGDLLAADLNGDGKADLLAGKSIFLGAGDGTFNFSQLPPEEDVSALADINADGTPDAIASLVLGSNLRGGVRVGNGDGTFGSATVVSPGSALTSARAVDMNGDGKLDLVVADEFGGSMFVLINQTPPAPGARFSPAAVDFSSQTIGIISTPLALTLNNVGTAPLKVTNVSLSGTSARDFSETNDCMTTLQPSISCTIYLTFAPTILGEASANLTVVDNAVSGGQVVAISGTGTPVPTPETSFSPTSVRLSPTLGTTSTAMAVTLTNIGTAALMVTGVSLSGSDAAKFSQTNNCTTILPGAGCTLNVTFAPTALGTATANLVVTDNAGSGSQVVPLSGTGTAVPDFAFGTSSGTSSSATVSAGQSATFNLSMSPTGSFRGVVDLACTVQPFVTSGPTCKLPASVSVNNGSAATFGVTIATMGAAAGVSASSINFSGHAGFGKGLALLIVCGLLTAGKRRGLALCTSTVGLALVMMTGCGGGRSSSAPSAVESKRTPAGTYTATIIARSGNLSHKAVLTLIVQ